MSHGFYKKKPLHLGLISVTKVCLVQFLCSFYKIVSSHRMWTRGTGGRGPQDKYEDCGSVQVNLSVLSDSLWPHGLPHARLPHPSPTSGAYLNSCPSSRSSHPTIASSAVPFSGLQFSPTWGSFQMSQFFTTGGQSIGTSASVLLMNIQGWFPLGLTGLISLQSKGFSRVFSSTTVQKHQFFGTQPSLWFDCLIYTWLLGKP